jgi:5-methylcytosine-specific restriction endonuclease McrA
MPIRPENRHRYTAAAGWPEIRRQVLLWDGDRCAFCGVPNHAVLCDGKPVSGNDRRDAAGSGRLSYWRACQERDFERSIEAEGRRWTVVVLTVAHLDHGTDHGDPANLRALCQRCHNRHDQGQRQENVARTRRARRCAGQQAIEGVA